MNYRDQKICNIYLSIILTTLVTAYLSITSGMCVLYVSQSQPQVLLTASHISNKTVVLQDKSGEVERLKPPVLPTPKVVEDTYSTVEAEELRLLARLINAEAGNQPYEGMIAVGNVVMNRVESDKFPDTIRKVIYQKGQFSPVTNGALNKKPSDEAIRAAREVMKGVRVVDESVVFFYNPDISTSRWIFTRKVVFRIGDHAFAI